MALAEQSVLADEQKCVAQCDLAAARFRLGIVRVSETGLAERLEALRRPRLPLRSSRSMATAGEFIARLLALGRRTEAVVFYRRSLPGAGTILALAAGRAVGPWLWLPRATGKVCWPRRANPPLGPTPPPAHEPGRT